MMERAAEARDYLADDLENEGDEWEGFEDWFSELADHLRSLPPEHPLCARLAVGLEPFLVDDDRIDCILYPLGEAVEYMDSQSPGINFDVYLEYLTLAIEADHARWLAHIDTAGENASWTIETGPPVL